MSFQDLDETRSQHPEAENPEEFHAVGIEQALSVL